MKTAGEMAMMLPVLFMPTQQVGKSDGHFRFPGTLTLSAQTLMAVWMALGACVARAGTKKLVLLNAHSEPRCRAPRHNHRQL